MLARFFVDENDLALGNALAAEHGDVVYPGHPELARGRFVLTGRKSQTTIDSRAILDHHWVTIEALVDDEPDGPWMWAVTESGLRRMVLG